MLTVYLLTTFRETSGESQLDNPKRVRGLDSNETLDFRIEKWVRWNPEYKFTSPQLSIGDKTDETRVRPEQQFINLIVGVK